MALWILIGALTLGTLLFLVLPLLRRAGRAEARAAYDRRIYRDQLAELDRDLARGVLSAAEAEASRAEIGRRLLAADEAARREAAAGPAPRHASRWLALALILGGMAGALGLYGRQGSPELPGQPLAARTDIRPSQVVAEQMLREAGVPAAPEPGPDAAEFVALVTRLKAVLADRQDDLRGHRLLAGALARLGQFADAHVVQARVIGLAGTSATAEDHADLAEYMIMATNGYVSPEAEAALAEALRRDPGLKPARYYAGLAMAQNGRPEAAYRLWAALLREGPADAPWIPAIREQIAPIAAALGLPMPEPGAAPPAAPDAMEAVREAEPQAQEAMIRGMVEGLADRLAREGGPPEDWAKLIRALGVLGERERARAIWQEAQARFGGTPGAMALLREAAMAAGVAE
ncbi:MAG TPA: c-type cytochrome biogenesis protein CcmI [Paracoccaceae bacterium]|nr:c-type cytochrome biogenesis protein CcmI [Paracoccaceae bacterium]